MNRALAASILVLGFLLASCGGTVSPGTPTPEPATSQSPQQNADPLAKTDPCALLTQANVQKNGLTQKGEEHPYNGARLCQWDRDATDLAASYTLGIAIFDQSAYKAFPTTGLTTSDYTIGDRPAVLVHDPSSSGCFVNFFVTPSSHVEVSVVMSTQDVNEACTVVKPAAGVVAGNLPAGS